MTDTDTTEATETESEVEELAATASSPLTTPCTLIQLRQWLKDVDCIRPGNNTAQVTATATSISVA